MTVLDTFFIMFKTNADDVKRGMDTVNKVAKETEKNLKDTDEQASTLGKTFVKMVEGGAELAGMFSAFNLIKAGVINQRDYNAELGRTAAQLGQNAGHLKAFAQAAEQVRKGSRGSALSEMVGLADTAQLTGGTYDPWDQMERVRARYRSLAPPGVAVTVGQARYRDNAYQTPALRDMVGMSAEEFDKIRKSLGVVTAGSLTPEDTKAAEESSAAGSGLDASIGRLNTTIGTGLFEHIDALIAALSKVASNMGSSFTTAIYTALAYMAGKGLLTGGLARGVLGSIVRTGGGVAGGAVADAFGGTIAAATTGVTAGSVVGAGLAAAGAVTTGAGVVALAALPLFRKDLAEAIVRYKYNQAMQDATKKKVASSEPVQAGEVFSEAYKHVTGMDLPANKYAKMVAKGQDALSSASDYNSPVTVGNASVTIGAINIDASGADAKQIAQHIKAATQSALSTIQAQVDNGRAN